MKRPPPLLMVLLLTALPAGAAPGEDWPAYGGSPHSDRQSPLTDIDARTVNDLRIAWTWSHGDRAMPAQQTAPGRFETTPLMVDGLLYASTPYGNVVALDPVSGAERWRFDTHGDRLGPWLSASGFKHRGVAMWRDGGHLRIFVASRSGLFSLDGVTGAPTPGFGTDGRIALTRGVGNAAGVADPANLMISSPPLVVGDVVIVGGAIPDRLIMRDPQVGSIQAFDARTGARLWTFDVVPQAADAPGARSWRDGGWAHAGHGNVWAPMSADVERGLIYLPASTTSNDFYGGARPGDGLFGESLVCLDARTGAIRWYRQLVHHGVWDYDPPAAPNLITIRVDGRQIDAVAQVTKQGFVFTFDRVTGEPVWPIEERPVPTDTDIPGETMSPTQPVPSRPPPLVPQGLSEADANDLTPEVAAASRALMRRYRIGPLFTPQTLRGTLQRPSVGGGANWGGAAFDPGRHRLFVRVTDSVSLSSVSRQESADPDFQVDYGAAQGSRSITLPGGLPITRPPYALLVALDMDAGTIAWRAPLGEGAPHVRRHPMLSGADLPARMGDPTDKGGPLVSGDLVFITGGDGFLYAFDAASGRELWRHALPARLGASPMTYRARDGRQYLVVATGSGEAGTLVAFALPQTPRKKDDE